MNFKLLFAAVICIALFSVSCFADTFYVDANSPADFNNIQAAINDANNGDIIVVKPGRYIEHINTLGKAITLQSTNPDDPQIIAGTIIDGNDSGTCITCNSHESENTLITGFLITDGNSIEGGGTYCTNSSPTIKNCTFTNNKAERGGGLYCDNESNLLITDCVFNFNEAIITTHGGYNDGGGAIYCQNSSPQITNCSFNSNSALGKDNGLWNPCNSGYGGAVFLNNSTSTFSSCTFNGNYAFHHGGGVLADIWDSDEFPVLFSYCIFNNNTARQAGGAVFGTFSKVENTIFNNNHALGGLDSMQIGNCGNGGAISGSADEIIECSFSGNTAKDDGGAISGGAEKMTNCKFYGNNANYGGAIAGVAGQMTNCTLTANRSINKGGAIYNNNDWCDSTVTNCTFNANVAYEGSAFYVDEDVTQTISNCTFQRNISTEKITYGYYDPIYLKGVVAIADYSSIVILGGSFLCSNLPNLIGVRYPDQGDNIIADICPDIQQLKGDIDSDGQVDTNDLQQLAQDWLNNN